MREIAIVTRGGEVIMIGGGSSELGRLLTQYCQLLRITTLATRLTSAVMSAGFSIPQNGVDVVTMSNFSNG